MARIFVSYNRQSLDAVKALAQDLEAAGNRVWFDQALTGGQRWWDNILANIRDSEIFVFDLTPESLDSNACRQELHYADQLGKGIVPILLSDGVNVALLPHPLSEIQFVDYRRQDKQAGFALIKAVNQPRHPVPLPDPLPQPPPVPVSYLSNLKERIDTAESLTLPDQLALVFELKEHVRDSRSKDEVCDLLVRLRQRHDLLAKVRDEIDAALAAIKECSFASATRDKGSPTTETRTRPVETVSSSPAAPSQPPEAIDLARVATETERILSRVLNHHENWVLEIDSEKYITMNYHIASGTESLIGKARFRDNYFDSKERALETLGWKCSSSWKGFYGHVFTSWTFGLSRKARDLAFRKESTRSWTTTNSKDELAKIASELNVALQKIAPEAKTIMLKKQVAGSDLNGI